MLKKKTCIFMYTNTSKCLAKTDVVTSGKEA